MKLDRIVLHNYLSHPDTTLELNGSRLAAFVGANGAGKSALLDSIRYILFDDGRAKTDQLVRLGETDMSASVEFGFAGATYRAVRGRTTKGAGKSYLELAVQADDGSWTSLIGSGDDIRVGQARIQALLGVDADTFGTAVFLGQGEANRFAEATAGERKRILGQVLGLEVFVKAEARARDEARTLEATTAMDRSTAARLEATIAELEPSRGEVEVWTTQVGLATRALALASQARDEDSARLLELAPQIATGDVAAAEVIRLEAERTELGDRYRRERAVVSQAAEVLEQAADVDAAAAALPGKRAELQTLIEAETGDRERNAEIARRRAEFAPKDRLLHEHRARWTAELRAAQARVTDLQVSLAALEPVICRKCGTANVVDQAGLAQQLVAARAAEVKLAGEEPPEPMAHSRERVAIKRLEERQTETPFDRDAFVRLQGIVASLERAAGRAEAVAMARTSKAEAEAELARIAQAGEAIAERIRIAAAARAAIGSLIEERDALLPRLRLTAERMRLVEVERRHAERSLAKAEADVARLEQLIVERREVVGRLVDAEVDAHELRRLVAAFGVTGIPARIIEGVLPELSGYANELLGELRPGMALDIRAQRAKKDGKGVVEALDLIVRDDVGERPLAVFSGGERMSVSLAIATALSRLVARRAGTAIRTLVIDEPDGLDADARRSFGQALRVLAHHGELERVVLVSHHPDLAEYGDAVYQVSKNGAGSMVELVAQ